jgi:shikimate 5-dehydrogenase
MARFAYAKADCPTIYFIGVTTGKSSIMKVFPRWAEALGIHGSVIRGMDFAPHAPADGYRAAVSHIKADPLALGALVTTHKIDLLAACRDLFDELDPHADMMGEISCISKRDGRLVGHAKDPITSGLALEAILPPHYWAETDAEFLVLGAGGSAIAVTSYALRPEHGRNRPSKVIVTNRSRPRLEAIREIHQQIATDVPCEYHHCPRPEDNDRLVKALGPNAVVANATGLGKDAPGSPITDSAQFPREAIIWDFNYRGELVFLDQARAQERSRALRIEDGWIYFIHGWTSVIAEVFHIDIPSSGPRFDELSRIAAACR